MLPIALHKRINSASATTRIEGALFARRPHAAARLAGHRRGGAVRVLVTGATGFTGGHLARSLAARGDRVRVLVRPAPGVDPVDAADRGRAGRSHRCGRRRAARPRVLTSSTTSRRSTGRPVFEKSSIER